jgi:hypothetical protein
MSAVSAAVVTPNVSEEIDQLIDMIEESSKKDWKRPGWLRKYIMIRKVTRVKAMVDDGNFTDAYDKMLHNIKPKLTGLKTDENEDPWTQNNCRFRWWWWRSWVKSSELKEEFRLKCNRIMTMLNEGPPVDEDPTAPIITITYYGGANVADPGYWEIYVEDMESGLDEVRILIDGVEYVHDQGFAGAITDLSYYAPVPGVEGSHTIDVTAANYDVDWVDTGTATNTVIISP